MLDILILLLLGWRASEGLKEEWNKATKPKKEPKTPEYTPPSYNFGNYDFNGNSNSYNNNNYLNKNKGYDFGKEPYKSNSGNPYSGFSSADLSYLKKSSDENLRKLKSKNVSHETLVNEVNDFTMKHYGCKALKSIDDGCVIKLSKIK
jgi:hypothetical protein